MRVIEVPFEVPAIGLVKIGSVSAEFSIEVPPGLCALRFELFPASGAQQRLVKFYFIKKRDPTFRILRADEELNLTGELLTSASSAI